mgnify:CR=1 FL=1
MSEKKNFSEKIEEVALKIADPLSKFASIKGVAAATSGIAANMNIIIVGSVFMLLFVLSSSFSTGGEKAILPFLEPFMMNFVAVNNFTLGLIGLLASVSIASVYAKMVDIDQTTASVLSLVSFLCLTTYNTENGGIPTAYLGSQGLFIAMFSAVWSVKVYKWFVDRHITIKLPDSVPPAIANSFVALIPSFVIVFFCWFIRNLLNIDVVGRLYTVLVPLAKGSESVAYNTFTQFLYGLFWGVGMHGGNMITPLGVLTMTFLPENAEALAAGVALTDLPHWQPSMQTSVTFMNYWPLFLFMALSKCKQFKQILPTMLIPAIFNITEPLMFGLPIVLNPFLMIPYIITQTLTALLQALAFSSGFVATKVAVSLPWALPWPLKQIMAHGFDIKVVIMDVVILAVDALIFYPFWKAFEKSQLELEEKN